MGSEVDYRSFNRPFFLRL